jgi:aminoglycoside phosphotransferase (APT) family kinase protein
VERGGERFVLRRPARVAVQRAEEGLAREFRILTALGGSDVPHPAAVALCEDRSVIGSVFLLMEHVDGLNPMPPLDPTIDAPAGRRQIAFAMVDALAAIHDFDWRGRGLADLGRPDGFHERQVSRWTAQLASYEGREMPGIDRVAQWLGQQLPVGFEPALMHGDFHMFNLLVARETPHRVVAVVDWETATIGDPLLDLAGFCEIWCPIAGDGWPDRSTLEARYCERRGLRSIRDLRYYDVLYNFRMAVLLEGIHQRSLRDPDRAPMHAIGDRAMANLERALVVIDGE